MAEFMGSLIASGERWGIVVSRFNEFITRRLLKGACSELIRHGAVQEDIDTVWVPGAFEVPLACRKLARRDVAAVIALACVLRGETPHFDYVCAELSRGVMQASLSCSRPIIYGAVTADTLEQAIHRAGGKHGNRGEEAARTAIEMANLIKELGINHPETRNRLRLINLNA